jgi:2-oxoglutarate dehydrogenase E2 component (dihydrolipoamide succinyltransferase)
MSEKIVVPVLGESISEATVAKWLKKEGDSVEADEPIVELETDKVNLEVPSPITGTLIEINSKDGSTVEVGALLGSVSENGSAVNKIKEIKKVASQPKENNVIPLEVTKKSLKFLKKQRIKKTLMSHLLFLQMRLKKKLHK